MESGGGNKNKSQALLSRKRRSAMKNKIAVLVKVIVLAAILVLYILYLVCNSRYVLAKRFFNINVYQYDVIEVENTLSNLSYAGKYEMTMQVGEGMFDEFVTDLGLEEIVEKEELEHVNEDYFEGEVLDGGGIFFGSTWPAKSNNWFPFFYDGMPKSVYTAVRYEEPENGTYKVRLIYKE